MRKSFLKLCIIFLALGVLSGCIATVNLRQAQDYAQKAEVYYQQAVCRCKALIRKGRDLDKAYFALGKLYYGHGDFSQAIDALRKANIPEARKLLAISYYKSANFVDALEIFHKEELADDEHLYYHGLTCEKLNLFDQALNIYGKIKSPAFIFLTQERIRLIEKETGLARIEEISPQVSQILDNAPPEQDYPQAGALILFCDEKIEVSPQNTQTSHLHYIIKILNERGKGSFSETHIDYDSTFEKVELEYARTIKPDGTVIDVGIRHIRDVSKYLNFPLYSNARVFIISFPEITEGASIEYKVKIYRNQLINKKDLILNYPVQTSEPIIQADFTLDLPKEKTLHIKILNEKYNNFGAELKPKIQEVDNRIIYSWQFKNIPQIIPEANMPPQVEINPVILVSTFNSWHEVYSWWWQLAKDKIQADKAIKDKVIELTPSLNSDEEKIRAIYNFCAKKIRYVAVEYGQAGYEPHPAAEIFKNKYGDCKDQAILLATMLKEAGLRGFPALISTKDYYNLNEDLPSAIFNHAIAATLLKDQLIFLDPTAETCTFRDLPSGDQDRKVLLFKEDSYEIKNTPLYPAEHNLFKHDFKIRINSGETITAEKNVSTGGVYEQGQRYWLLYTPPELIQAQLQERIQDISIGAKLDDYKIKNVDDLNEPVLLSYRFNGPEYFTDAGKLRIMPQLANLDNSLVARDKRKYAIDFGILDTRETIFEIILPSQFTIKYMPEDVIEESPWLKFIAEYKQEDNKVYFRQKAELKKNIITEEEYPDFKIFFENLIKKIKQRIVLEKTN